MITELRAGAKIETLTKRELQEGLRDWMVSTLVGARPVTFSAQGTIAAGAVQVGGNQDRGTGILGPDAGFVWFVRRVAVQGLTLATDPTSLFIGEALTPKLIYPALTGVAGATGYKSFNSGECILAGTDRLLLASTGAVAATGVVTLTGAALEVPQSLLWKYL